MQHFVESSSLLTILLSIKYYIAMQPKPIDNLARSLKKRDSTHLTPFERGILVGMKLDGASFDRIHKMTGVSKGGAHKIWKAYEDDKENYQGETKPHGRPKKTTQEVDESLYDLVSQDQNIPYHDLNVPAIDESSISIRTIQRRLSRIGIKKWMARRKFLLDEITARNRLRFCLEHAHWSEEDWAKVIFSDETTVQRGNGISRGRKWVFRSSHRTPERWKTPNSKWAQHAVHSRAPQHIRKITQMMWSCFAGKAIGPIVPLHGDPDSKRGGVTSCRYLEMLETWLPFYIKEYFIVGETVYFMHDGAGIHRAKIVKAWMRKVLINGIEGRYIKFLDWPAYSPDLNPIENAWSMIKTNLDTLYPDLVHLRPKRGDLSSKKHIRKQIDDAITHCWELLPCKYFEKLSASMVSRINSTIEVEGWYTKY